MICLHHSLLQELINVKGLKGGLLQKIYTMNSVSLVRVHSVPVSKATSSPEKSVS